MRGRLREGGGKGRQSERESGEEEEEEVDEPRRRGGGPLLLFLFPSLLAFVSINGAPSTDQLTPPISPLLSITVTTAVLWDRWKVYMIAPIVANSLGFSLVSLIYLPQLRLLPCLSTFLQAITW